MRKCFLSRNEEKTVVASCLCTPSTLPFLLDCYIMEQNERQEKKIREGRKKEKELRKKK